MKQSGAQREAQRRGQATERWQVADGLEPRAKVEGGTEEEEHGRGTCVGGVVGGEARERARARGRARMVSSERARRRDVKKAPTLASSSTPHPGNRTPINQIFLLLRSGAASPSSRYRIVLSNRLVFAPALFVLLFVVKEAWWGEEWEEGWWEEEEEECPWAEAAFFEVGDRAAVVWGTFDARATRSAASPARRRLRPADSGCVPASSRSSHDFYGIGSARCSTRTMKAVPSTRKNASRSAYAVSASLCQSRPRCAYTSSARAHHRGTAFPEAEVLLVLVALEACDADEDAADGGRSTESDLKRSRAAAYCRKRGSLEVVVGHKVKFGVELGLGDVGAGAAEDEDEEMGAAWKADVRALAVPVVGADAGVVVADEARPRPDNP
ncbi:hypothetical protein C8R45DRAFT_928947 [Mycena sanguinolenta]|nr:hypothetical protein C8R45DRAFT_928947 [Mycena sanguinolenta]